MRTIAVIRTTTYGTKYGSDFEFDFLDCQGYDPAVLVPAYLAWCRTFGEKPELLGVGDFSSWADDGEIIKADQLKPEVFANLPPCQPRC